MRQNAIRAVIAIAFLSCSQAWAQADEWSVEKSKHFLVYYQQAPSEYIRQVIKEAEHYYKSITAYFGFTRFNFWSFDDRCKIYLYPNHQAYVDSTAYASWSQGGVHVIKKEIATYVDNEEFFDSTLPHEMGHIIFREVIGFDKKLPLWIDEAVAVLQEKKKEEYLTNAKTIAEQKLYFTLETLSDIKDFQFVIPYIFYCESASIVDFLLQEFGKRKFIGFCRQLEAGKNWQQALLETYGFKDLEQLQQAWLASLENNM